MEIAIDLMASLRERIGETRGSAAEPVFDWNGLHGRLTAAHAARAALQGADSRFPVLAGGFASWEVQRASSYASRAVNRVDLADRKIPAGIERDTAAIPNIGGRGQT